MSEVTDAINAAEAALEAAKAAEAAQAQVVFQLPPHVGDTVQFPSGEIVKAGTSVSREEFEALRSELNSLNQRIADFNQRSGQRI